MIMIALGFILLVIGAIIVLLSVLREISNKDGSAGLGFIGGAIICLSCVVFIISFDKAPSAIDVYRGNTELVIHYEMRDSVLTPIDSVVVFKKIE